MRVGKSKKNFVALLLLCAFLSFEFFNLSIFLSFGAVSPGVLGSAAASDVNSVTGTGAFAPTDCNIDVFDGFTVFSLFQARQLSGIKKPKESFSSLIALPVGLLASLRYYARLSAIFMPGQSSHKIIDFLHKKDGMI